MSVRHEQSHETNEKECESLGNAIIINEIDMQQRTVYSDMCQPDRQEQDYQRIHVAAGAGAGKGIIVCGEFERGFVSDLISNICVVVLSYVVIKTLMVELYNSRWSDE